jgi:hypothetical protein
MNLQNFRIEKQQTPDSDWKVYGDITDDENNVIGTFGEDGTSVNQWWIRQDDGFQASNVRQFALAMAQQIVSGEAE